MGWVQIHATDGTLEFEEGREQMPDFLETRTGSYFDKEMKRLEKQYAPEDFVDRAGLIRGGCSQWLAERLFPSSLVTEREWRNEQIAKRLKEIEEGAYDQW